MTATGHIPPLPACRRCGRRHRTWRTLAGCVLRPVAWVTGDGPWGSVADCPRGRTAILFPTEAEARRAKAQVDRTRCGGACIGQHRVKYLGD